MRADRRARAGILLGAALGLALTGGQVLAAPPAPGRIEGAKAALADGDRSFQLGRFDQAIEAYERAYSLDPRPAFLFNIGLAHRRQYQLDRKIDHLLRARELYRNYLKLAPDGPRSAGVEKILIDLEAQIDQARATPAVPAAVVGSTAVAAGTSPAAVAPPVEPVSRTLALSPASPAEAPAARAPLPALGDAPVSAREPAAGASPSRRGWWIAGGAIGVVGIALAVILIATASHGQGFDGPGIDLTPR